MAGGQIMRRVRSQALKGRLVVVTAGPTVEDIDPVRFISNRSSGRMGVALAGEAAERGARVLLIHGPLQVPAPRHRLVHAVPVRSARDMHRAVMKRIRKADVAILCAAVADFSPARSAKHKIKKNGKNTLRLELVKTPDILADIGALKRRPVLVGFAAETRNTMRNAKEKFLGKNCDLLCANNVLERGSGFGGRTNRITIFRRNAGTLRLPLLSKPAAAVRILDEVGRIVQEAAREPRALPGRHVASGPRERRRRGK